MFKSDIIKSKVGLFSLTNASACLPFSASKIVLLALNSLHIFLNFNLSISSSPIKIIYKDFMFAVFVGF